MVLSTQKLGHLGLSLFVLVAQTAVTEGKDNVLDRYTKQEFKHPTGQTLHYRWYLPSDLKENETVPILLFLHGAGERGDDNQKTLVHGAKDFLSDKLQSLQKCAVVIPQCPNDQQWVNVPWTDDEHTLPAEPSTALALVSHLLDELCETHPIDENRIYLTGLSMGGFGAWDLVSRAPNRFAAVIPICGGGDSRATVIEKFKHVPVWVFHGDADPTVKVKRSRDMIRALKTAGAEPEYTEYPNVGHNSWTSTYANPKIYQWLLTHQRNDDN
ncbi:MAG: PHB depolymerase family esterase [Planctomycetota bacterium]|nr:PHB depolymerase family esterase [Planctomycetota bacterium]